VDLLDLNVWFALLVPEHPFHPRARAYWEEVQTAKKYLRVLLDLDPRDVKKEGVPCGKIVSTPSTILTQKPSSWPSTSGWVTGVSP